MNYSAEKETAAAGFAEFFAAREEEGDFRIKVRKDHVNRNHKAHYFVLKPYLLPGIKEKIKTPEENGLRLFIELAYKRWSTGTEPEAEGKEALLSLWRFTKKFGNERARCIVWRRLEGVFSKKEWFQMRQETGDFRIIFSEREEGILVHFFIVQKLFKSGIGIGGPCSGKWATENVSGSCVLEFLKIAYQEDGETPKETLIPLLTYAKRVGSGLAQNAVWRRMEALFREFRSDKAKKEWGKEDWMGVISAAGGDRRAQIFVDLNAAVLNSEKLTVQEKSDLLLKLSLSRISTMRNTLSPRPSLSILPAVQGLPSAAAASANANVEPSVNGTLRAVVKRERGIGAPATPPPKRNKQNPRD